MALDDRVPRAKAIVAKLADAGYPITWELVLAQLQDGATVGRPHIADTLVAAGRRPRPHGRLRHPAARRQRVLRRPLLRRRGARGAARPRRRGSAGVRPPGRRQARRDRRRGRDRRDGRGRPRPASRSTTATTRRRPGPGCARWPPSSDCWSPAPATTTAAARRTGSARTPPTPRSSTALLAQATSPTAVLTA